MQGTHSGSEAGAALPGGRVRVTPRARVKSLVMWSGGLDSTYALARLLDAGDDEVFAHHVHCHVRAPSGRATSRRCEYEAQAVAAMLPALRDRYRSFHYSESRVDLASFSAFARDTTTAMFFAAQAAMSQGFTPFDRILLGLSADQDRDWMPGTNVYALRRMISIRALKAVWECEEVPYLYLWNPRPTKREEIDFLPGEIVRLTASCRDPRALERGFAMQVFEPCGRCAPCRALSAATAEPPPA